MTTWLTTAEACEQLHVHQRTLYRYVTAGLISVRIDVRPGARGRVYSAADVAAVLKTKRTRPLDKNGHNKASQRALWRLAQRYPKAYATLRAEELAKERGSPAATGNPPTSTRTIRQERNQA